MSLLGAAGTFDSACISTLCSRLVLANTIGFNSDGASHGTIEGLLLRFLLGLPVDDDRNEGSWLEATDISLDGLVDDWSMLRPDSNMDVIVVPFLAEKEVAVVVGSLP